MTNLKKPEEYLERIYITDDGEPNSVHDSVSSVVDMIKQAQHDAYNQAIDDAYLNARIMRVKYDDEIPGVVIDKKSILKLKI